MAIGSEGALEMAGCRVIPLVRKSVVSLDLGGMHSFHVNKQPVYVVVDRGSTRRVFRVSGEEISLDLLVREVPAVRSDPALGLPPAP